jgi:aminopeptidase N
LKTRLGARHGVCASVGVARRLLFSTLLLACSTITACSAEDAAPGDDQGGQENDLTRFATPVDKTLPDVDAQGYEIDLRVEDVASSEKFKGEVKGTYVATRDLDELVLDFVGNRIDEVTVGERPAEHRREDGRLIIKLPTRVANGRTFTTRIKYHGDVAQVDGQNPNDFASFGGFMIKQRNPEGKRIYTSLSWPSKARRWLPLRDHPRDGAMVTFSVTFPKTFTVLANGKRVGERENADGSKTWRYEALTPMPTYDFHVSAYEGWKVEEMRSGSGVPIATYTYPGAHRSHTKVYGDIVKVMDFYESKFGKYRWGTSAFIEEPIFGGGMEHASVISMDETLFPDPSGARETAFHELGHHWSGNLVRYRRWNDFWLSEGFTEYLTARAITEIDGKEAGKMKWREYLSKTLAEEKRNPHPLAPRGEEIDVLTIFDDIPYEKGALTVRMLENIVGEAKMAEFLKGWFDRHAFQAMTSEDLERELSQASGKDLSKFFSGFVYSGYHPELRVTFAPAGGETEVKVEQLQTKGPSEGFLFPLMLDFVDASGRPERVTVDLTGKTTTKRLRLARTPASVVVDPDEWAIAVTSCGQSGGASCREGFRCASQGSGVSACVPQ